MKNKIRNNAGQKSRTGRKAKRGPAEIIVELARAKYRFGMSTENEPFAVAHGGNGVAVLLDQSTGGVKAYLHAEYHRNHGRVPSQAAVNNALEVLRGQLGDCRKERLHLRVARHDGGVVIDIGDHTGRAIVVTPGVGWEVVDRSPVLFRRNALTAPLTVPVPGGTVKDLRKLINVAEQDFELLIAWLVAAFVPDAPHPILLLSGTQGTGKSFCAETLLDLFDPSTAPRNHQPRDVNGWQDLASNRWGLILDNISSISPEQADLLCKAVTGDSLVRRKLYSNREVITGWIQNVVLLTSIDPGAVQGDLGERIVRLELEPIPPVRRLDEGTLKASKAELLPGIFGALLDGLAQTLDRLPHVTATNLPRMADFGRILAAADDAEFTSGALERYRRQQEEISRDVVDGDSFGVAVKEFALNQGCWQGTAVALLEALGPDSDGPPPRDWPKPNRVWTKMKRFLPQLGADGITITQSRANDRKRTRLITITVAEASEGAVTRPGSKATDDRDWDAGDSADRGWMAMVPDDGDDREDEIPF